MASLSALAMSSTKDELLKHLDLPSETYSLMAKETDRVYIWLTSEKSHLKSNCKRKPPYDWSDIQEKSKDEAMEAIAKGGDEYTDYYWRLATPAVDCPNWIARWFLYHKFRYRDGRNRTHQKSGNDDRRHHHESRHGKHHKSKGQDDYYEEGSMNSGTSGSCYPPASSSSGLAYYDNADVAAASNSPSGNYYDPVRDV